MHEPDWEFLGAVALSCGIEWARALRDAIADGTLIDYGDAPAGEQPPPLPASSGADRGHAQEALW